MRFVSGHVFAFRSGERFGSRKCRGRHERCQGGVKLADECKGSAVRSIQGRGGGGKGERRTVSVHSLLEGPGPDSGREIVAAQGAIFAASYAPDLSFGLRSAPSVRREHPGKEDRKVNVSRVVPWSKAVRCCSLAVQG